MATTALRGLPSRTERTIVIGRVVLAASSLGAVWLDPNEPARYVVPTYTLHVIYAAYAVGLAAISWNRPGTGQWPLVTHVADIAVCSVFQLLSLGPTSSPFFTYFVFSLFCAALRWGWRGTLRTAALVLALFLAMGVSMRYTVAPEAFDLNRYVSRAVYLAVVAGLLMFLGQHEERLRRNIVRLARWPSVAGVGMRVGLARALEHGAQIVGARRALVAWEVGDEPWMHLASWSSAAGLAIGRHGPDEYDPLVPPELTDRVVLRPAAHAGEQATFFDRSGDHVQWHGPSVHPGLASHLEGAGLISAPFSAGRLAGRVFFTDLTAPTVELITMAKVVAREIGSSLQQLSTTEQLSEIAASEERLKVARDLHDGVLQSLTGIRFELRDVAEDCGGASSQDSRDRLLSIERALAIEQRELRMFIDGLKPQAGSDAKGTLLRSLDALRDRVAYEWKVPVTVRVDPHMGEVPAAIENAIPPMVHEAVANALKHGNPSRIRVDVDIDHQMLRIIVADDGRGFPFRGRYDHAALAEARLGPASLCDRAASLGGTVTIDSDGTGARVEIALPLAAVEA